MDSIIKEMNESFQKSCEKINKRKEIEDTPEVMELRKLRDEYYDKAREYQKQIDETIKKLHNVPDLVGKCVHVANVDSDYDYYGKVEKVERLFDGIRINFSTELTIISYKIAAHIFFTTQGDSVIVEWDNMCNIDVITEDDIVKIIDSHVVDFKNSLNN